MNVSNTLQPLYQTESLSVSLSLYYKLKFCRENSPHLSWRRESTDCIKSEGKSVFQLNIYILSQTEATLCVAEFIPPKPRSKHGLFWVSGRRINFASPSSWWGSNRGSFGEIGEQGLVARERIPSTTLSALSVLHPRTRLALKRSRKLTGQETPLGSRSIELCKCLLMILKDLEAFQGSIFSTFLGLTSRFWLGAICWQFRSHALSSQVAGLSQALSRFQHSADDAEAPSLVLFQDTSIPPSLYCRSSMIHHYSYIDTWHFNSKPPLEMTIDGDRWVEIPKPCTDNPYGLTLFSLFLRMLLFTKTTRLFWWYLYASAIS